MNSLIKHLWENNRKEIISKSIKNCHVKGLHSIMLLQSKNKTIRMYISDYNSELVNENGFWDLKSFKLAFTHIIVI